MQTIWDFRNKIAAFVKLQKFCIYIQIKDDLIKNSMQKESIWLDTYRKIYAQNKWQKSKLPTT